MKPFQNTTWKLLIQNIKYLESGRKKNKIKKIQKPNKKTINTNFNKSTI